MKTILAALSISFLTTPTFGSPTPTALELLRESDRGRGGVETGLQMNADVSTIEDGDKTERKFVVKAKESDSIAESTYPPRTKSEVYVFNDRNMWFLKAGLKKPVAISPRAKLTGLASNGDIATTRYARDYEGVIEKEDLIDGQKHFVLILKAKNSSSTYDKIRYWINSQTKLATKAEFLNLNGNLLKSARFEYKNTLNLEGKKIPFVSEMKIQDAKRKDYTSTITYSSVKSSQFKTGEFNINNIRR